MNCSCADYSDLVTCRVVNVDAGVIPVQFARDDALRRQLREIINRLAPL
jgi:hypothetical protein